LIDAIASRGRNGSLRDLASRLEVDHTVVHRSLKNAEAAGLYRADERRVNPEL
jgi:DNA-binding IclR family transcriptional regulator